MKIFIDNLPAQLEKKIFPIYIVSGDEPLLGDEALNLIRQKAHSSGFSERIRIPVDTNSDWAKLFYENTQSFSLFATKRILELDLTNSKLSAGFTKTLQEYAKAPVTDTLLLIRMHKLDSKVEQSAWYKSLDKIGGIVPIWPLSLDQLPTWINKRAKNLKFTITPQASERLAIYSEGNLLAAANELEKLSLLYQNETVDEEVIENIVEDLAHFDIFGFIDSILIGDSKRSLRILDSLAKEATEPVLILWAITRELRVMSELSLKIQQGSALSSLFSEYRIWEKRKAAVAAFLRRHKQQDCWKFLIKSAEIDRIIKGVEIGNVWNELEKLTMQIISSSKKI